MRRRAADDPKTSNDAIPPVNNRGTSRQQRSAMVSREVEMLQRDRPHPTFNNAQPDTLRPEGAGQTVDPEAIGEDVGPGPMGHNDGPAREGPRSQGIDMSARMDVDAGVDSRAARSDGPKSGGQAVSMEDGAERGGSGMEAGQAEVRDERISRPSPGEEDSLDGEETPDAVTSSGRAVEGIDYVVKPEPLSEESLILEQDGATIAASNFEAVIEERLRDIAEPGISQHDSTSRNIKLLTRRFIRGQPVRFTSQEEKAAVLESAKSIAKRRAASKAKKVGDGAVQEPPKEYTFAPLPEGVQKAMIDKMVKGKYEGEESLWGNKKYKQTPLNNIAKVTAMNSTYLSGDGERLLKKVRSLLPSAAAATQAQQ